MSLRKAINAMCRHCTYDPQDIGSAAQQIACCTCKSCPLYKFRPMTAKSIPEKLLRAYKIAPAELDRQARALLTSPRPSFAQEMAKMSISWTQNQCRGQP